MRIFKVFCLISALAVILAVSAFAVPPVIIQQPSNYYFPADIQLPAGAYFNILASGDNLTYQWQSSVAGSSWVNTSATGAQTPSLVVSMNDSRVNGRQQFRCIVSNSEGQVVSQVVSASVGAFVLDSLPQFLSFVTDTANNIFSWASDACSCIVQQPLLLFTVGFLALGGSIAVVSRLLARS